MTSACPTASSSRASVWATATITTPAGTGSVDQHGLHWDHPMGSGTTCRSSAAAPGKTVGGYPVVTGSQDMDMDQLLDGHIPQFAAASTNKPLPVPDVVLPLPLGGEPVPSFEPCPTCRASTIPWATHPAATGGSRSRRTGARLFGPRGRGARPWRAAPKAYKRVPTGDRRGRAAGRLRHHLQTRGRLSRRRRTASKTGAAARPTSSDSCPPTATAGSTSTQPSARRPTRRSRRLHVHDRRHLAAARARARPPLAKRSCATPWRHFSAGWYW